MTCACCRASTSYTWTVSCRGSSKPTHAHSAAISSAQTLPSTRSGGGTSSEGRGQSVPAGPAPFAPMPRLLPAADGLEQGAVARRRQSLACMVLPAPLQTRVAAAAPPARLQRERASTWKAACGEDFCRIGAGEASVKTALPSKQVLAHAHRAEQARAATDVHIGARTHTLPVDMRRKRQVTPAASAFLMRVGLIWAVAP